MVSEGELKDFAQGQSLHRVLQPWWDVFSHYLTIVMFMIGTVGGTLQVTFRKIVCVPLDHPRPIRNCSRARGCSALYEFVFTRCSRAKIPGEPETFFYIPYAASHILFEIDCVVETHALMPFQAFHCVHTLAVMFWLLSLVYTVLMIIYGVTCLYSCWWLIRNSLREYNFDSLREESSFSDIPDVKNDFAFILHLLDQYNPLFSKRFAVFLSEVSEKKLRQLNLNYLWSLEKMSQKLVHNTKDQLELHLMLLSGVPDSVFDIRELEVLKLQLIPDARLPQKLTQLVRLKELWLDHSPATVHLMALDFLAENLRILRIKFSDVNHTPWWIFNLRNLSELYLYGNLFSQENSTFINGLPKLRNLKVLFLKCSVTTLPKAITNSLQSVQKLFIDNEGAQLTTLQNLKMMSNLISLELLNCDLQRIPSQVFSLKNLQEIDLKGNNLKTIEEIISFQHLPKLHALRLKNNSIAYIPVHIGVLENLEQLQLSQNYISLIPTQLFLCSKLYHVDLSHNHLSVIPAEIQDLKRLQLLNVSNNNIDRLPDELFQCKTLQFLLLSHNCLTVIPDQVRELINLVLLDIKENQLESLPAELEECQNLVHGGLLVEEGLLNSLPPSVKEGFQTRPDKEHNVSKLETEGAGHSLNCNQKMCNTSGHGDSGPIYSM